MTKLAWSGVIQGVQPRIDLGRSFDQRFHSYLGYLLVVDGQAGGERRVFAVRIGTAAQARHGFRAGDHAAGFAHVVEDLAAEVADLYKVSALELRERAPAPVRAPPPWLGIPPTLEVYRARGHRRLDARTYQASCAGCQWGCRMAVKMIIDQWNPSLFERRFETFCYGPKSCPLYRAGPKRKVRGRRGMSYTEEDWVDEEATRGRSKDE